MPKINRCPVEGRTKRFPSSPRHRRRRTGAYATPPLAPPARLAVAPATREASPRRAPPDTVNAGLSPPGPAARPIEAVGAGVPEPPPDPAPPLNRQQRRALDRLRRKERARAGVA